MEHKIIWKEKEFVFIFPNIYTEFVGFFNKNKEYVLSKVEEEFGKFLFDKVYIIVDDWGVSIANFQ